MSCAIFVEEELRFCPTLSPEDCSARAVRGVIHCSWQARSEHFQAAQSLPFASTGPKPLGASWQRFEGHSYAEVFDGDTLFPRRMSSLFIGGLHRSGWGQRECVFVMDANSTTDIIDFWNLRAIGWNVMPAPTQFLGHGSVCAVVNRFYRRQFLSAAVRQFTVQSNHDPE